MQYVSCLIIGQGLAGTVLHHVLTKHGVSVALLDEVRQQSASSVATGTYNPLVLRSMQSSAHVFRFFESMHRYYDSIEILLGQQYRFQNPIIFPFVSDIARKKWQQQSSIEMFQGDYCSSASIAGIRMPYGAAFINYSGYVHVARLLTDYRLYVDTHNLFYDERFEYEKWNRAQHYYESNSGRIYYNDIIFCVGMHSIVSPDYQDIYTRMKPLWGDSLMVRIPHLWVHNPVHHSHGMLVPSHIPQHFFVGSTLYHTIEDMPHASIRQHKLERALQQCITEQYTTIHVYTAARPVSKSRISIVGNIDRASRQWVFTGLGVKGIITVAYWAEKLAACIIGRHYYKPKKMAMYYYSAYN